MHRLAGVVAVVVTGCASEPGLPPCREPITVEATLSAPQTQPMVSGCVQLACAAEGDAIVEFTASAPNNPYGCTVIDEWGVQLAYCDAFGPPFIPPCWRFVHHDDCNPLLDSNAIDVYRDSVPPPGTIDVSCPAACVTPDPTRCEAAP